MSEGSVQGSSSTSKSLMWMMIALFGGMAVLLGGGLFLASRVVKSMGLSAAAGKDTIKTPGGNFKLEKPDQVGPGLPVYPHGSLELPGDNVTAAIKDVQNGEETVTYHTADTREFVDEWYSKHLSPEYTRHDAAEKPQPEIFREAHVLDTDVVFLAERGDMVRIVDLATDATGTKIALVRINKTPPAPAETPKP